MSKSEHPDAWRVRLREAVNRTGKKHSYIAELAGVAPETLSRVLTGTMTKAGFDVVVRITHAAGESVGWILGEYGYSLSEVERKRLRDAAATIIENNRCRTPAPEGHAREEDPADEIGPVPPYSACPMGTSRVA